nr:flap endonuclease GEN homolog 1-like [Procambarus clarkii]
MGVMGLWGAVAAAEEVVHLDDLNGLVLALDAMTWLVKSRLRTLFYRLTNLIRAGVVPLVVLDGKVSEWKLPLMGKRRWAALLHQKCNISLARKKAMYKAPTGRKNDRVLIELLQSMGVPFMQSNGEAEKLCVWLEQQKLVDGIITEDSDVLLYGAQTVYRKLSTAPGSSGLRYRSENVREKCGLTHHSLIGLGVLVGCDLLPSGAAGIGLKKALKLVHDAALGEERGLRELLHQHVGQHQRKEVNVALTEFLSSPVVTDFVQTELQPPDTPMFMTLGTKCWHLSKEKSLSLIAPLLIRWYLDIGDIPGTDITYLSCYEPHDKVFGSTTSSDELPMYLKISWSVRWQDLEVRVKTVEATKVFQQAYTVKPRQ